MNEYSPRTRERFLVIVFFLFVTAFFLRLGQVQLYQHTLWSRISEKQTLDLCELTPPRGEILDRNGMPLAVTLPLSYAVGFRPTSGLLLDPVSEQLSGVLPLSQPTVRRKLDANSFIYLARRVDWKQKQQLESLELPCLQFDREARRAYPAGMTLASVLGFVNLDGIGQAGIEQALNFELAGVAYSELHWRDAHRTTSALLSEFHTSELRGSNITLTIDLQLQALCEEAMRRGLADLEYERACALLVDPWTGDILSLATEPSYDPNNPGESSAALRKCWPVMDVYEPGSTLKIIPISKALEDDIVQRTTRIFCEEGAYRVRGATIHDSHPYGVLTVDSVLAYSSNIGAAKIAEKLSPSEFYDILRAFGFGNKTGIAIPSEQGGVVPKPSNWSGPTCSNLAMGHGLSCTALQVAMAYAAIANGGNLMKPNLVYSIERPNGETEHRVPQNIRTVLQPKTAAALTDMLENVVEYGTGKSAAVPGLRIAGKTGTAQKVDLENHTYFHKRFVSSFVGFFPADNPRYLLLVLVDDPLKQYYGATVAAPIFKDIAGQLMEIRPDDFPNRPPVKIQENISHVQKAALTIEESPQFQCDSALTDSFPGDIPLVEMPVIEGLPLRSAALELSSLGLNFELDGSGIVYAQYPRPGEMIPAGYSCRVQAQN